MVYHILELYLRQKADYREKSLKIANVKNNLTVSYICLIILFVIGIAELFFPIPEVLIAEAVTFVVLFMLIFIIDRKSIKKSKDRVKAYDEFLNELQKKLIINDINWAEGKRIEYLISECDNLINAQSKERRRIIGYAQIIVLPIAKIIADIIKDKVGTVSIIAIISVIFGILLTALVCFVFINIVATLTDLLLKTGSINEIKNLRNTLKDIKMRQN
jgi:ABC-type multidrug transport system fused ATPase/permease subunit